MGSKKLLYHFNRAPHGTIFWTEGFRAAVGATAGIDEHKVTILFQADGVWYTLKNIDKRENDGYLQTLEEAGTEYYVVKEDLEKRGIGEDEVQENIRIIPREEALALYKEADFILDW
jgi:sulfur relay (sulfurtransferase) DsrF/TusC family protein